MTIEALRQYSKGEAGPAVNRDIEILFGAVNTVARAVANVTAYVEQMAGGASVNPGGVRRLGAGMAAGARDVRRGILFQPEPTADVKIPHFFSGIVWLAPTTDITLELGAPSYESNVVIVHAGDDVEVTIENTDASVYAILHQSQFIVPEVGPDDSGGVAWGSKGIVYGLDGQMFSHADHVFREQGTGPVIRSPDGTFFRIKVNDAGILTSDDLGGSEGSSHNPPPPPVLD